MESVPVQDSCVRVEQHGQDKAANDKPFLPFPFPFSPAAGKPPTANRGRAVATTHTLKGFRSSHWPITLLAVASILAGLVGLFQLAIGWLGGEALKAGFTTDPTPILVTLDAEPLSVPQNMIRFSDQRRSGPAKRIDMVIHWPSMEGYSPARADAFDDITPDAPILFVSIAPRMTEVDSTGRLINLYSRFFDDPSEPTTSGPAPDGLVGRTLRQGHGYDNEEIFFEAGSTDPFVARCARPDGSGLPLTCLREIHVGLNLSATYRFRRPLLDRWHQLEAGIQAMIHSMEEAGRRAE